MKIASEKDVYNSISAYVFNWLVFPLKMLIPQPIIAKIPGLTTNEDIRVGIIKKNTTGKLLDIGCGVNRLVKEYRAQGEDGIGIDVYDWGNVDLVVGDTAHLPYENSSFDTISFVACLNHIPNRENVLAEACRLLTADGRVLITNLTPVVSRIWHAYAFWDADQHERGMEEGEVFGFTHQELTALLERNGLIVVGQKKFSWGLNELFVCSKR